ncbi:MAG: HPP family protein [Bdellovibrionales bacterium]
MSQQAVTQEMKEPVFISPEVELSDALEIMRSWGMRHLPVTAKDGSVIGVVSERDIFRDMAMNSTLRVTVRDRMSTKPFTVTPDSLISEMAETMANHKYGCAVVVGPKGICGIFTTTDAMNILGKVLRNAEHERYSKLSIAEYLRG